MGIIKKVMVATATLAILTSEPLLNHGHAFEENHHNNSIERTSQGNTYSMSLQLWQDTAILGAPRLILTENELSEFIISNPDTLKIAFKTSKVIDNDNEVLIESELFLPLIGGWEAVASPHILAQKGERVTIEIPVEGKGFTHSDGRPVETLRLLVLIDDQKGSDLKGD